MKFELLPYHRNPSDEELIADLQRVGASLGKNAVSKSEQDKYGSFHSSTIIRRFGKWSDALRLSGLDQSIAHHVSDAELLNDVKRVASLLEKDALTIDEQELHGKFAPSTLIRRFGKWSNLIEKAGLTQAGSPRNVSTEDLFRNLEEIWVKLGRQPRCREFFEPLSDYSYSTYARRFGSWRAALESFVIHTNASEAAPDERGISLINDLETSDDEPIRGLRVESEVIRRGPRYPNRRLIVRVLMRDKSKCRLCGRSADTDESVDFHIDHIKPWSKGGLTVLENLQTLCSICNSGKSDLEFINSPINEARNGEF